MPVPSRRVKKHPSQLAHSPPDEPADSAAGAHLVQIEKPIYGGQFLARLDGKAVFVPLTLPGEQARIRVTQNKAGYATAEAEDIVTRSPERILPACPHFGGCGGCNYQHAPYGLQLAFKQAILRETLERAKVPVPETMELLAAEAPSQAWAYRNRIRLALDSQGRPGYRSRRSHAIIPLSQCPIAAPLLVQAALATAAALRPLASAFRPREFSLFCNADETGLLASFFVSAPTIFRFKEFAAVLAPRVPALRGAELVIEDGSSQRFTPREPRTLARWGAEWLAYAAAGFDYRVDHGAFFQVNRWLVDALVDRVTAGHSGALAWDLFAGVGLFARKLTERFAQVVAVESAPQSTGALECNLRSTGGAAVKATTLDFLRAHATPKGRNPVGGPQTPELIVLDPPRTGLGAEVTALLNRIAAPTVVYVSCDPATLARDLRDLGANYAIESITLADLFPQTFHLETVVRLRRA